MHQETCLRVRRRNDLRHQILRCPGATDDQLETELARLFRRRRADREDRQLLRNLMRALHLQGAESVATRCDQRLDFAEVDRLGVVETERQQRRDRHLMTK